MSDPMLAERDDVIDPVAQHLRDATDRRELRADSPGMPPFEESARPTRAAVLPEVSERFLDRPSRGNYAPNNAAILLDLIDRVTALEEKVKV